jgi:hypothetical protein
VGEPDEAIVFVRDNEAPQNVPPKVAILDPPDGSAVKTNTDVEVSILTLDPDGYVPRVELYEGTNLIDQVEVSFLVPPPPGQPQKFSITWSNVPLGDYVLVAKAIDDLGASTLSEPVEVRSVPISGLPIVKIRAVDGVASEPDPLLGAKPDTALFEVSRKGDLSNPLNVHYSISGTASNSVDYQELPGELTIPAGAASALIEVIPSDDSLVERTESVVISLIQLPCVLLGGDSTPGCYLVGQPDIAITCIRDADSAPQEPPTVAILSPPNGAVLTAQQDVRLVAAAHDPDGWVATVEFFDGTTSLGVVSNKVWALPRTPPQMPELLERTMHDHLFKPFSLIWRDPAPGKHEITALATDSTGTSARSAAIEITVLEDSATPVVNIMATDAVAREDSTNTATFKIRRSGSTNGPLKVHYTIGGSAQNGIDYAQIEDSFTIPAGLRNARITVQPLADALEEGAETVILELSPSPEPVATYEVGRLPAAACVILDFEHNLTAKEVLPGGRLHFRLPMPAGIPYRLEASSDLRAWQTVVSDVSTENGVSIIEEQPVGQGHRFFRVIPEYGTPEME